MKHVKLYEEFTNDLVNEARVKAFNQDLDQMISDIKRGYGWIDPEYVEETWENSSDTISFDLVKAEVYKKLIAAKVLAYPNDDGDEEAAGKYVKSLKELGIKESLDAEAAITLHESTMTDAKGKEYKVKGIQFTYIENNHKFYGAYLHDNKNATGNYRNKLKLSEINSFIKELGVSQEVPARYNESELDKLCKALSNKGIVCKYDDSMDVS